MPSKEAIAARNQKLQERMDHIGTISTRLFSKLQVCLQFENEAARYAACYNMLVLMKEADAKKKEENDNQRVSSPV